MHTDTLTETLKPIGVTLMVDTLNHVQPLKELVSASGTEYLQLLAYILSIVYAILKLYKETDHYQRRRTRKGN